MGFHQNSEHLWELQALGLRSCCSDIPPCPSPLITKGLGILPFPFQWPPILELNLSWGLSSTCFVSPFVILALKLTMMLMQCNCEALESRLRMRLANSLFGAWETPQSSWVSYRDENEKHINISVPYLPITCSWKAWVYLIMTYPALSGPRTPFPS